VGELRARGYRIEPRRVAYEFQRGGNRLFSVYSAARLRLRSKFHHDELDLKLLSELAATL
jgi:hypothetical protein